MLKVLKTFSDNYAKGVSALVSVLVLIITLITFLYLQRDFAQKYRPYVDAVVVAEPTVGSKDLYINIVPRNVGEHPCEFKLTNMRLHIGDETYETPNFEEWMLLAPKGVDKHVPAGYINEIGITKVRESRYKSNRINIEFDLHSRSVEQKFEETKTFFYEINVLTEKPIVLTRPEWQKKK